VLLGLFVLATALGLIFERRAFCSHICPIGGFTGIYAKTAPLEVRVLDTAVCATHSEKSCYQACPWGLYPVALRDSAQCGLCMECLRACPSDNIALNVRPFGVDLAVPRAGQRLDEAFLALMMLGSALAFSAVFTGPWGALKLAAFQVWSFNWLLYALGFLALNLGVLPGLLALAVWARRTGAQAKADAVAFKKDFARQAQALLPLGLCAWIAFTISFAFPKLNYVVSVLSDPLGWGWDLFGTAHTVWAPDVSPFSPALQAAILLLGLVWAGHTTWRVNDSRITKHWRWLPIPAFCTMFTLAMLWLLIG
jgi:Fe-S-cluster-containing hydrogenase component 2